VRKFDGKSRVHEDIIQFYQAKVPKLPGETDDRWRDRIKRNPSLLKQQLKGTFDEQIKLVAMRRALAVAGGQRTGASAGGPNNASSMASRYVKDTMGSDDASRTRFAEEQIRFLNEAFDYAGPRDGNIFWTGVDPDKLAVQVPRWNAEFGSAILGALEATTDARYINGGFDYYGSGDTVKATQGYFTAVSDTFGRNTAGHVTAVQVWGVRKGSVFEVTELPLILNRMASQLAERKTPDVTDISMIVLDPVGLPGEYKIFQNLEIGRIGVVIKGVPDSVSKWIRGRQDCVSVGDLGSLIPVRVKAFWMTRPTPLPSPAARKIAADYPLIKRVPAR
jgi:hypothetical protein